MEAIVVYVKPFFGVALASLTLRAGGGIASGGSGSDAAPRARPVRLHVVGHVNPGGGYSADVYGPRSHAYLPSWHGPYCPAQGVRVYDLRAPARPVHVSTFADRRSDPLLEGTWTEKTIVKSVRTPAFTGDLAVTSFQRCTRDAFQGFGLYDVTNPARPRKLALVRTDPGGSHEIWLEATRNRAYVYTAIPLSELVSAPDYNPETRTAGTPGTPDFRIFDVSDPARPVQVGAWGAWRALGIPPRRAGSRDANFVHSVVVNGDATRAYLSYWDLGTVILDIRRPAQPRYLGRTRAPSFARQGAAHSVALARRGTLLVETHETSGGYPTLFDITNPRRPRYVGAVRPREAGRINGWNSVHDARVLGNRAYFSWYGRGVVVADISRPRRPRIVARYVPPPAEDRVGRLCQEAPCTMVWGVFVERRYVLASDIVSGLWVLRLG